MGSKGLTVRHLFPQTPCPTKYSEHFSFGVFVILRLTVHVLIGVDHRFPADAFSTSYYGVCPYRGCYAAQFECRFLYRWTRRINKRAWRLICFVDMTFVPQWNLLLNSPYIMRICGLAFRRAIQQLVGIQRDSLRTAISISTNIWTTKTDKPPAQKALRIACEALLKVRPFPKPKASSMELEKMKIWKTIIIQTVLRQV